MAFFYQYAASLALSCFLYGASLFAMDKVARTLSAVERHGSLTLAQELFFIFAIFITAIIMLLPFLFLFMVILEFVRSARRVFFERPYIALPFLVIAGLAFRVLVTPHYFMNAPNGHARLIFEILAVLVAASSFYALVRRYQW